MGYRCPDCDFVMPLHPHDEMTWCPCGWRSTETPGTSEETDDEEREAA